MSNKMKIPAKRIVSDECAVFIGRKVEGTVIVSEGEAHYPHKGEWVEVLPISSVSQLIALGDLMGIANEEDATVTPKMITQMKPAFNELCEHLANRVVAWNWTDWDGSELPQPYKKPEVIAKLTEDEVLWLLTCVQSETREERKKD